MDKKNLFIASIIANVALAVLVFIVKDHYMTKGKEYGDSQARKAKEIIAQVNDNIENNNVLWTLIDSIWKSPDKDRSMASIRKLAETQKVPRCGGKACVGTEDEAKLKVDISSKATDRSITIGWISKKNTQPKYFFKVKYKEKGKNDIVFDTIDANDLLGKSPSQETDESGE